MVNISQIILTDLNSTHSFRRFNTSMPNSVTKLQHCLLYQFTDKVYSQIAVKRLLALGYPMCRNPCLPHAMQGLLEEEEEEGEVL